MKTLKSVLQKAKRLRWEKATVSFYIVHRRLVNRAGQYLVAGVNIDQTLAKKIRTTVADRIQRSNTVRIYDFNTSDLDDDVLAIETGATDFQPVIDLIGGDEDIPDVTNYEELIGSWMYIARLDLDGSPPLYAARKVAGGWTAKKVTQLVNAIFENNMLVDLDHKDVFRIDAHIDFFAFDDVLFVADKKNFETALNFREGMLRARDEIVKEFEQLGIFTNAGKIADMIGDNVTRLRRLAQVKNSGYYRDTKYLEALKRLNASEKWGLQYERGGTLTATDATIEDILRLLNNDRLNSKINDEVFDVDVKHKLASPGA